MRWKTVPSKYVFRASDTSDAVACGDVLVSSETVKTPQLVRNASVHVFAGSRGLGRPETAAGVRGFGASTFAHPVDAAFFPPPQPAAKSARTATATTVADLMRAS